MPISCTTRPPDWPGQSRGASSECAPRVWCESGAMSTAMPFDDDLTRRLVEMYTIAEVVAQRDATLEILNPQPGERVLDIGSGPGFLAAGIASRVGQSGAVSGIDLSASMIAYAGRLAGA